MPSIYAKGLTGKKVVATDGTEVGKLESVIADMRTGELINILIKPDISFDTSGLDMEGDFIRIPFVAVKAAKDVVTIDMNKLRYDARDLASIEV